jgi:hypothetical protein
MTILDALAHNVMDAIRRRRPYLNLTSAEEIALAGARVFEWTEASIGRPLVEDDVAPLERRSIPKAHRASIVMMDDGLAIDLRPWADRAARREQW